MKAQLVIMAAGIGSRYKNGTKQLTPVGKNGEVIMEYAIHEAVKAGFDEVVVIIRKEIEKEFMDMVGNRIEKKVKLKLAFQELNDLPNGFSVPDGRKKPYGTAHALYAARNVIDSPFLVINADDYYGVEGFKKIYDYLIETNTHKTNLYEMCMASYIIENTLSKNGTVTRGICEQNADSFLTKVVETFEIAKKEDGVIRGLDGNDKEVIIKDESLVSMNMFGLPYEFIGELENRFIKFLEENNSNIKSEFLLPTVVNDLINEKKGRVKVLKVYDKWYGITYAEDKDYVINALKDVEI